MGVNYRESTVLSKSFGDQNVVLFIYILQRQVLSHFPAIGLFTNFVHVCLDCVIKCSSALKFRSRSHRTNWSYLSLSSQHPSGMHFTRFDADSRTTSNGCTPSSASAATWTRKVFLPLEVRCVGLWVASGEGVQKEAKVGLRSRDGPGRFSQLSLTFDFSDRSTQGL